MAKSRKRKGHRKRITTRRSKIDQAKGAYQKLFDESIRQQVEELKKKQQSESTGTTQTPDA